MKSTQSRSEKSETRLGKKGAEASGQPSFAKALFHGQIDSNAILPYPKSNPDEQQMLQMTVDAIEKMGKEINPARIEEEKRMPDDVLQKFREMGLFGLIIPEQYGGFGFSNTSYVQILAALSIVDSSITATIAAHQSIGLKALLMFGSDEQKEKYLPKLATGEMIAAFGLTEPGAGSDAGSLKTAAELSADGSHYVLNGGKIWITNGGIAQFYTVFARTKVPKDGITCFIVTRDMEGFSTGAEEKKLGLVGSSTVALTFDNVKVPRENVIGEPGKGFKIALGVLNNGRLGLAGACAMGGNKVIQHAMDHALQRKQFNTPLADFGLIQSKFAAMVTETFAAEAMVRTTAALMDGGKYDYSLESAMCKIFCTEAEWRLVNECLQIAGGTGYMKEYGYEKVLRDSRIFTIWEGANEILRLFVGLSGLQGPGEELRELAETLKKPMTDVVQTIGVLSDFGVRWIQRRVATRGVSSVEKLEGVHPSLEKEAAVFDRYVAQLATEAETALRRHGKKIVQHQFAVKRIAEIAIDLYAVVCTLSRVTSIIAEKGEAEAKWEIQIAKTFCRKARRRMAENFRRMEKNDDEGESLIAKGLYERGLKANGLFS
jgi:acyl-CoA dehydrogenase family protein 9